MEVCSLPHFRSFTCITLFLALMQMGCGDSGTTDPKPVIASQESLPAHPDCSGAATVVRAGPDADEDGELEANEVSAVVVVCGSSAECDVVDAETTITVTCGSHPPVVLPRSASARTLASVSDVAPVQSCPDGGFTVTSGADDGSGPGEAGNGILDASEIDVTETLCIPHLLTVREPVASHADCDGAATLVHAGLDRDGNGVLDASEVDVTTPLCVPGIVTSTEDVASASGCAGAATIVRAGLDLDASTVLEPGEESTQVVVCGSSAACSVTDGPTSVTVTCGGHPAVVVPKAPPGAVTLVAISDASAVVDGCSHGGFVVTSGADDGIGTGEAGNGVLDASEIDATQTGCLSASLSSTQTLTNHPSCPGSAKVVTSGVDFDEDGVLDANEIGTSTLVCDASDACVVTDAPTSTTVTCGAHPVVTIPKPPTPAVTLVSVTNDPPIATCPRGGFVVRRGADDGTGPGEAGNGTLDASEVEQTTEHCAAYCGDGNTDAVLGESCDDGNAIANDGCSAVCVTEPSCLPPSPDVGCPPSSYHVEGIAPGAVPVAGGVLSLFGDFPPNTSIANTTLVLHRGGPGSVALTATLATPTEIRFMVPAGGGKMTLDLDVSGADIPHWERSVDAEGRVSVVIHADVPLRYVAPMILATSGCAGDEGDRAVDCSPAGGPLRITGTGFGVIGSQVSVHVGGAPCVNPVVLLPGVQVECSLPAGTGFDVPVVITVEGLSSAPSTIGYFGPRVTSVALQGQPPASDIAMPDTFGTHTLTVTGDGFSSPTVELTDGTTSFPCVVLSASVGTLDCAVTRGAGADLRVVVSSAFGGRSRPSSATLHYPPPSILPGTLRPSLMAPGGASLLGTAGGGDSVFFDVMGLNGDVSVLDVAFGPTGGPYPFACVHLALHGTGPGYTVECTMPQGAGSFYVFVVRQAGVTTEEGADTYSYPAQPTIDRVAGCSLDTPTTTEGCPTSGGTFIDIFGADFSLPALVTVGGASCSSVTFLSTTQLRCRLPAGVGNAPVVVTGSNMRQSPPHVIGYAPPRITAISGCTDLGTTTTGCPTSGGIPITITGTHFGASGATVFVDGARCIPLQHDLVAPHERLTCTLPAGSGANRAVWIVNGAVSDAPFHLSYAP